jgi:hypothetical protein
VNIHDNNTDPPKSGAVNGGGAEVHVSDAKGNDVPAGVFVPLGTAGVAMVDGCVEVE